MTQSQKRFEESLGRLFYSEKDLRYSEAPCCLFLKSSTDVGVIRNGGRNGARFAPQSVLSFFKKFTIIEELKKICFLEIEVANQCEENENFSQAQKIQARRIQEILLKKNYSSLFHLGGGHDHIFPLLTALSQGREKVIVINIDAHADTRVDADFNSGTPFRQFSAEFAGDFHLFQIGLNHLSNSLSTLSPLEKGKSQILWRSDINDLTLTSLFQNISSLITTDSIVVFSLDADALNGFEIPGVSAINPRGISVSELVKIWSLYQNLSFKHPPIIGIYELNPLYDTISSLTMKTIGGFIFETLVSLNKKNQPYDAPNLSASGL